MWAKLETTQGNIWYMRNKPIFVSFDYKWIEQAS